MPLILPKWKEAPFEESGICRGAPLHTLTLTYSSMQTPMHYLVIFRWRSMFPIVVRFGLDWEPQSIWIDFNQDNKAEEYYFNMNHYQVEYGKSAWFCKSLQRLLEREF